MPLRLRRWIGGLIVAALLAAACSLWAFWKPIRTMAPEWAGVRCFAGGVCTDDPARVREALALKSEALTFVHGWAGHFDADPRIIFCTSARCDQSFGFKGNAAYNVGAMALVVSSRGWQPYYVRHELIHCLQVERIGGLRMLLHTPRWLIEGMAYSASQDPRHPLQEPWESYRRAYEAWAADVPEQALWARAAAL